MYVEISFKLKSTCRIYCRQRFCKVYTDSCEWPNVVSDVLLSNKKFHRIRHKFAKLSNDTMRTICWWDRWLAIPIDYSLLYLNSFYNHENCCRERTIRDICSQHETQETSGFFFFDFLVSSPLCVSFAAKIRVSLFLCTYGSSIFSIDRQQRVPLYSISICLHYLLCRSKVGQLFPLFDLCSWLNSTKYSSIYYQFAKCRWWEMVKHYL